MGRKSDTKEGKLPLTFFQMVEDLNLTDAWRYKHPEPNQSVGRLDAIWISTDLLLRIKKTEFQPRTVSDHNPVTLELRGERKLPQRWRMNETY